MLTKYVTASGPRWALDGQLLAEDFSLESLPKLPASQIPSRLRLEPVTGGETPLHGGAMSLPL